MFNFFKKPPQKIYILPNVSTYIVELYGTIDNITISFFFKAGSAAIGVCLKYILLDIETQE